MTLHARDWALAVVALAAATVCVRLGVWQLNRLDERRARNAEIRAARERPPIRVTAQVAAESVAGRRVVASGRFDYENERLWRGRMYQGAPGVRIITPLWLGGGGGQGGEEGAAVLVDRGWVASADAARINLRDWRGPDSADITGLGIAFPRGRGDVDPKVLADTLPYPLLNVGVQIIAVAEERGGERSGDRLPLAPPPPELGNGPHLVYAVQWFSFAAIALIGTFALLRTSGRRQLSI